MHGRVVGYAGDRVRVVFAGGDAVVGGPAAPFREVGLTKGDFFVMIARRRPGGELVGKPVVKRVQPPQGSAAARRTTPAVYVRRGRAVTTRR